MSEDHISVSFKCKQCGTKLSWPDDISDATEVRCSDCGQFAGTYGDLKEAATKAAKDKLDLILKDVFKRR